MIFALIDNGSLEPAAQRNLRAVAAALSVRVGMPVRAVSWKHSDRIPAAELDGTPAWTLDAFLRSFVALGQREFVFIPFFISAQGAIGSALRREIETLQRTLGGFEFRFTAGLANRGVIPAIAAAQIRETVRAQFLVQPPVIVVDHGGPSAVSAHLRDAIAGMIAAELGREIGPLAAASMEGAHPPLLAEQLRVSALAGRTVVVAPLFLSPGRHAGPTGDIVQICAASSARCHVTGLVGTHPLAITALAAALQPALTDLHAPSSA